MTTFSGKFTRRGATALLALFPALALARNDAVAATGPKIAVSKDPSCGCCGGWVDHLKAEAFEVDVTETADLEPVKARLGVPSALAACHTAEIEGYVVEGHVPAAAIRRLLAERPQARGLAVPGMPVGAPGMEVSGAAPERYDVMLFGAFGQRVFARFEGTREVPL